MSSKHMAATGKIIHYKEAYFFYGLPIKITF